MCKMLHKKKKRRKNMKNDKNELTKNEKECIIYVTNQQRAIKM